MSNDKSRVFAFFPFQIFVNNTCWIIPDKIINLFKNF